MFTTPVPPLNQRLRQGLSWRNLRMILTSNTAISVAIAAMGFAGQKFSPPSLFCSFIFSQSIGLSIYLLIVCCAFIVHWDPLKRWTAIAALMVFGGIVGSLIALLPIQLLMGTDTPQVELAEVLKTNTVLALIFGTGIWLYFTLNEKLENTAAELAEKKVAEQRLQRLKTRAELDALRAQVNPHFLFNTLNSIASLIAVDAVRAEEMVQRLADLFRYTLDASRRDLVELAQELDTVRQYLEIEKVRLGRRLEYKVEVAADLEGVLVPGLLLQPLVENSIKHGIAPQPKGGQVTIRCRRRDACCHIEVADTGQGCSAPQEGFGLRGVRERLELHYGQGYHFDFSVNGGVHIHLSVPLEVENHGP